MLAIGYVVKYEAKVVSAHLYTLFPYPFERWRVAIRWFTCRFDLVLVPLTWPRRVCV